MSKRPKENILWYLLLISLLLHAGAIALTVFLPAHAIKRSSSVTYMIDLRTPPARLQPSMNRAPQPAPGKEAVKPTEKSAPQSQPTAPPLLPQPSLPQPKETVPQNGQEVLQRSAQPEPSAGEIIVRRGLETVPTLDRLFPGAAKLSKIEEYYRKKYESDIGGNKMFLDADDAVLGVYKRRFREAVLNSWRSLKTGKETAHAFAIITVNRNGTVVNVRIVESSGSESFKAGVVNAIRKVGYVGPLPKEWPYNNVELFYTFTDESR